MPPRSPSRDLVWLSLLCAAIYLPGLTTHGLTNWQEGQRALVARDMAQHNEWLVPTVNGQPYLAKPPLIYWCQLALSRLPPRPGGETPLRLTVALAGWLGVIATYLVARRLFAAEPWWTHPGRSSADHAAWWAALFLATGILYVRSSRIGEIDILLVAPTVAAVGAIHALWHTPHHTPACRWPAVILAALAAAAAALAKGPPALLLLALASFGGIVLWFALPEPGAQPTSAARRARTHAAAAATGAVLLVAAALALHGLEQAGRLSSSPGLLAFAAIGASLGLLVVRLVVAEHHAIPGSPGRTALLTLWRAHAVTVVAAGMLALWLWLWLVARRIGSDAIRAAARGETADNLRLLTFDSPLNNLEAMLYGVGAGSITAVLALVWLVRRRPRVGPGLATVLAWIALGFISLSTLGKGVPRYLTPVWPAIALFGGCWFTWRLAAAHRRRALTGLATTAVLLLAAAQSAWYAWGREIWFAHRSPRAFIAELLAPDAPVRPGAIGLLDIDAPAAHFYAGRILDRWTLDDAPAADARPLDALPALLATAPRPYVLLVPTRSPQDLPRIVAQLEVMNCTARPMPVEARWTLGKGSVEVQALLVARRAPAARLTPLRPLPPQKQPFYLPQRQPDRRRPTMRTARRPLHGGPQAHQRAQLLVVERIARLDRRPTRHHVEHLTQRFLTIRRPGLVRHAIQQIADECGRLHPAFKEHRRKRMDGQRGRTELRQLDPELLEQRAQRLPRLHACRGRLHHRRRQQSLAFQPPLTDARRQRLEHHPLVQCVLIDDHHAIVVLRNDVRVVHLHDPRRARPRARRARLPRP